MVAVSQREDAATWGEIHSSHAQRLVFFELCVRVHDMCAGSSTNTGIARRGHTHRVARSVCNAEVGLKVRLERFARY